MERPHFAPTGLWPTVWLSRKQQRFVPANFWFYFSSGIFSSTFCLLSCLKSAFQRPRQGERRSRVWQRKGTDKIPFVFVERTAPYYRLWYFQILCLKDTRSLTQHWGSIVLQWFRAQALDNFYSHLHIIHPIVLYVLQHCYKLRELNLCGTLFLWKIFHKFIQIWLYPQMSIVICVTFQMWILIPLTSSILLLFKTVLFTASSESKLGQITTAHVKLRKLSHRKVVT